MFAPIPDALKSFAEGNFLIVVDNLDRENEGDLIIAAENCTSAHLAFMIRYTSGVICAPMSGERCDKLELPAMIQNNQDPHLTAFTVSCDAIGTGISAVDRAKTLRVLSDPNSSAEMFTRPGHIFPLRAHPEGVLGRMGHTEAAVDLCRLSGKQGCAAISEICSLIGTNEAVQDLKGETDIGDEVYECCGVEVGNARMAKRDELTLLAVRWGILMISIEDLRAYRILHTL